MSMLSCLRQILVANVAVNAIVAGRIAPMAGSQATAYPDIVYDVLSTDSLFSLTGISGLCQTRVRFMLYALTFAEIDALVEKVRLALQCFRGTVTDADSNQTDFQLVEYVNGGSLPFHEESQLFSYSMDFDVHYTEAQS